MKQTGLALLFLCSFFMGAAQSTPAPAAAIPAAPQDTLPALIQVEGNEDSLHFSAVLRPLRQVAGAPVSFYTYFWELGDGRFSFSKNPVYRYNDTGTYLVRLYATNNYDDGKAPGSRPHPVRIKRKPSVPGSWASHFFHGPGNIEMKINRNPKPGEDFVTLLGYRNQAADSAGGSIVLFFNERQFNREGFALTEKRTYHGEDSTSLTNLLATLDDQQMRNAQLMAGPDDNTFFEYADEARSMLQLLQGTYTRHTVTRFSHAQKGEERFLFLTMNTLPDMIQDTNATVTISAMLVPDNPSVAPELFELEMQVVASHDPNRLQLKQRRINYRFMGKRKELTYKVRFQNTGRGPAKRVAIGIAMPRQLNTATLQVKGMSPVCAWCDSAYNRQSCIDTVRTADSIYFVFNNIYLPGLQQEGITDADSTKGFVEYSIRFRKRPKKIAFDSRAAIIFDKNEPIYTNKATGHFVKGLSPGIMAGYTVVPSHNGYTARGPLQLGVLLAPYAPSKPYFQLEAYAGILEREVSPTVLTRMQRDTAFGGQKYLITGIESTRTTQRNSLQVVPLHYRYNIGSWLGIGAGALAQVSVSEQTTVDEKFYFTATQQPFATSTANRSQKNKTEWLGNWNLAPFADIQAGRVKSGPALGLRYLWQLRGDTRQRLLLYAVFKL